MRAFKLAIIALLFMIAAFVSGCGDKVFNYAEEQAIKAVEDHRGHKPDSTECDSIGPVHPHCE